MAALAAGTGAIPFAGPLGAGPMTARAADTPVPEAVPDEVVVRVAPGTSDADLQRIAAGANCTVARSLKYLPGFHVFRLNGVAPTRAAVGARQRAGRAVVAAYGPPTAQVLATVTALKQVPGVLSADPDYVARPNDLPRVPLLPGSFLAPVALGAPAAAPAAKAAATRAVTPFTRFTSNPSANTFTPNDPYYSQGLQKDMDVIRMPEAWAVQKGTRQVIVGVADTGIYEAHQDFVRTDGASQVVGAQNFIPGSPATAFLDMDGHGTHVSGTIAAVTNNATGVASVAGLARNGVDVRLLEARVLTEAGGQYDWIANGIGYLVANGANVINLSLGGYGSADVLKTAIQNALDAGVIVVASSGNDSINTLVFPSYPAAYTGVIEVGSVGNDKNIAPYSNFGGNITLTAPGGSNSNFSQPGLIVSTWPPNVPAPYPLAPLLGSATNPYAAIQGTSMASPHVAGAAALLLAEGVPSSQVPNTLVMTSQLPAGNYDPNVFGAGILDVYSALMLNNPAGQVIAQFADPSSQTTTYSRKTSVPIRLLVTDPTFDASQLTLDVRAATTNGTVDLGSDPSDTGPLLRTFSGSALSGVTVQSPGTADVYQTFAFPGAGQPDLVLSGAATDKYKLVLKYKGVVVGVKFIQVLTVTEKKGLNMFSVPFLVRQANPANPEQATFGTSSFLLVRYDPLASGYAYFSTGALPSGVSSSPVASFAGRGGSDPVYVTDAVTGADVAPVGLGFWLRADNDIPLNVSGDAVTDPVAINLYATGSQGQATSGWNMIGDPFPYSVPLSDVIVRVPVSGGTHDYTFQQALDNGIMGTAFVGWSGVDYAYSVAPAGTLDPFQAYWVQANRNCTLVVPPIGAGVTRSVALAAAARSAASRSAAAPAGGWRVRLAATVAGETDGQNFFGQAPGASDGADRFDVAKPPAAGHAYVRFLQSAPGGGASRSVAYDLHALAGGSVTGQRWTVAVSSDRSNADVTLAWGGLGSVPRRGRLVLKDEATGQTVAMATRSSYTFHGAQAGSTRQFTITLEPQASAGPLAIRNLTVTSAGRAAAVSGGGAGSSLAIRFTVSQEADVTGTVRTIGGKLLATLGGAEGAGRAAASAQTTLHWDGRSQDGAPLPVGTYVLELTARGTDGQVAVLKRPVLIAR